jgi:hypothetical protein
MILHQIMYVRTRFLVLLGVFFSESGLPGVTVAAREQALQIPSREPSAITIVADGSPGWQAQSANQLIQTFVAESGSNVLFHMVRFDAEPNPPTQDSANGSIQAFSLNLLPRMPMRNALMAVLSQSEARLTYAKAVIVIASEESYGSSISTRRLIGTARQREVPIYSILLTRPADTQRSSFLKRFGRALTQLAVWFVEGFIEEEGRPSIRDTSSLLEKLANVTDGRMYSATDSEAGVTCVREIAGHIKSVR